MKNRFTPFQDQDEPDIANLSQALLESRKKCLGPKKRRKDEWISDETLKRIEQRKEAKRKSLSAKSERLRDKWRGEYKELDKLVKRESKTDKSAYIEKLADETERAASKQDMQTLYRLTKTLIGKFQSTNHLVKDKEGKLISKDSDVLKRWKEHFENVLNAEEPNHEASIPPTEEQLNIDIEPPNIEEIRTAIRELKYRKAPGEDQIQAELLKVEEHLTPILLTRILQKIWTSEKPPSSWNTANWLNSQRKVI